METPAWAGEQADRQAANDRDVPEGVRHEVRNWTAVAAVYARSAGTS